MSVSLLVSGALLVIDLIAGVAVGIGIVLESGPPETPKERLGQRLVIWGVVIEAIAGFVLFGFDGYQSIRQQREIVAEAHTIDDLSGKLKEARGVAGDARAAAGEALTNAADASNEASNALGTAGDAERKLAPLTKQEAALTAAISADEARVAKDEAELSGFEKVSRERSDLLLESDVETAMGRFSAVPFGVQDVGDASFADSLTHALSRASIRVQQLHKSQPAPSANVTGITIVWIDTGDVATADAARTLCGTLVREGLDVTESMGLSPSDFRTPRRVWPSDAVPGTVVVIVGALEAKRRFLLKEAPRTEGNWPCGGTPPLHWQRPQP